MKALGIVDACRRGIDAYCTLMMRGAEMAALNAAELADDGADEPRPGRGLRVPGTGTLAAGTALQPCACAARS